MIAWMFETMVAVTLLMILVMAVRRPVAELFGAQWAYALWLLPVLLPLLPVPSFLPSSAAPVTIIIPEMPIDSAAAAAAMVQEDGGWTEIVLMLLALWAGGAVAFAAWQQSTYSAFMLHLGPEGRRSTPPSFGGIRVVESDAVDGPVAVGLFRRRIVVPVDFHVRYSESERRLALEHELVHHRRFDLLWNWIGLGLLTINWFNPIAHIAFRAFRADQELACDAAVTRRAPTQRHDYACALVKSASHPGLIAVCPLNHADMLKRRLRMMKKHRASWARTAGGAAALSIVGAAGLALATPGFAQEEAAAPAEVLMNTRSRDPIIARADVDRLREKCGGGDSSRGAIVCSDAEAKDPEVRAIVAKTRERVKARVAEVKLDRKEMAKIRKHVEKARKEHQVAIKEAHEALERARPELARIERGEHRIEIEKALAHARAELKAVHFRKIHTEAIRTALADARLHRIRFTRIAIDPRHMAEIEASLERVHKDLQKLEVEIQVPDIDVDPEHELVPLNQDH